jgi:hypothetical protein
VLKLSLSDISIPDGDLWLDTGILFPFFNKDIKTDSDKWIQALITLSKSHKLFTTKEARNEINNIFTRWSPNSRKIMASAYRRLFEKYVEVKDLPAARKGRLSPTDAGFLTRPNGTLITADRLLFESDDHSAVYVFLERMNSGYSYKLNSYTK